MTIFVWLAYAGWGSPIRWLATIEWFSLTWWLAILEWVICYLGRTELGRVISRLVVHLRGEDDLLTVVHLLTMGGYNLAVHWLRLGFSCDMVHFLIPCDYARMVRCVRVDYFSGLAHY